MAPDDHPDETDAHDPEPLREQQERLRAAADQLRRSLDDVPPAFDTATFGSARTTSAVNQAISQLFKRQAQLAATFDSLAEGIDPESGSFRGLPGIYRSGRKQTEQNPSDESGSSQDTEPSG